MFIRWIVYTRKKWEAKDIIEDALKVIQNQLKRCKYLSAKPYWKFDDDFIVEMRLKLQNGSPVDPFVCFLKEISEFWHLYMDMDLDYGCNGGIIAADNCNEFNNKEIEWVFIEFDWKTEQDLFEKLKECMEFIVD